MQTSNEFKTVIIDDEALAVEGIRLRLEQFHNFRVIHEFMSVHSALKVLKDEEVDIIFLDIQMPRYTGFDFLNQYHPKKMPLIVFVTAYDQFALEAFNVHAVDYLLKPIDNERFREMIEKVSGQLAQRNPLLDTDKISEIISMYERIKEEDVNDKFKVKSLGVYYTISKRDIVWVKAEGDYVTIYTKKQDYFVKDTLKDFEKRMGVNFLRRVHRSSLVNLREINKIVPSTHSDAIIYMKNNEIIKMSRTFKNEILDQVNLV